MEYLPRVASERRDATRQAIEQGAKLDPNPGGSHAYKLTLPDGWVVPLRGTGGRGRKGSTPPNTPDMFKNDLRRHGLSIDGRRTARGVPEEAEQRRRLREAPRTRRKIHAAELPSAVVRQLLYAEEIETAVTRICVTAKRYALLGELQNAVAALLAEDGRPIRVLDRAEFNSRVEIELNELYAHGHLNRVPRKSGEGYLYSTTNFRAPHVGELPSVEPAIVPPVAAPVEPLVATLERVASPAFHLPIGAWAALRRMALAFIDFCDAMEKEEDQP